METGTVEPMVEIFLEEVSAIVSELEDHIEEGKEKEAFGREQVDEIFRNIHTIKADAAMMLYENIARPARELEKVLYYYRDETNGVTDFEGFLELIEKCLAFVQGELHKLIQGQKPDGDSAELTNDILSYVAEIKGTPKEPFEQEEPEETFFYISSEEEPKEDPKKEEYLPEPYPTGGKEAAREPDKPEEKGAKRPKHILVPVEEMDLLDNINIRLLKYTNLLPPEAQVILRELDSWLWRIHSTDFTLMAAKLDMTVKTMLANVKKDVEFHVLGTELTIEKTKMEKISNAMIHLVRNAVDHGIEMPEERREAGKPLKGHVSVDIEELRNHSGIRIRVSDDGKGLDMFEILDKAEEKGLLSKPYEEYTEPEAFDLIFLPGFTTKEQADEYSGRGVGMDAVRHAMEEIGGTIRIESVYGVGTSFVMEIAYDTNIGKDDDQVRRALIDESLNSRR